MGGPCGSVLQGLFPLKLMRIFTRDPGTVSQRKSCRDLTGAMARKEINMEDNSKTVSVRTKQIGDTLLVIESAVSTDAKETAYNKIKRLILDHADRCEKPPRAA